VTRVGDDKVRFTYLQARLEVLRRLDLVVQLQRHGLARLVVLREAVQRGLVVHPVLHELRRELHGVPLDVVDAGRVAVLDTGEHVLYYM